MLDMGLYSYSSHAPLEESTACLEGLKLALKHLTTNLIIEIVDAFKDGSDAVCLLAKEFKRKKPPEGVWF